MWFRGVYYSRYVLWSYYILRYVIIIRGMYVNYVEYVCVYFFCSVGRRIWTWNASYELILCNVVVVVVAN